MAEDTKQAIEILPGLQGLLVDIEAIRPDEENPRVTKRLDDLIAGIRRFGVRWPIVVNQRTNVVEAGHQRLAAMRALGMTQVPVLWADDDGKTAKAFNLADNRLGEVVADWDEEALYRTLQDLSDEDWTMEGLGWADEELMDLLVPVDLPTDQDDEASETIDEASELCTKWGVRRGQIWACGDHRIMCGDSTSTEDLSMLFEDHKAVLMNTDPPYGISYVSNAKSKGQSVDYGEIENDELDGEKLQTFLEDMIRTALPHLEAHTAFYLWHPMLTQGTFFAAAAAAADILIHRQIIWVKPSLVFGRGDYHWKHELCFYGWIKGNRPPFYGERNQTTIWEAGRENDKIHPTQKPVLLFEIPMSNHTKPGQIVYEPFSGSGSQLIAAENMHRRCFAMEIEPKYVAAALERWAKMTDKTPELVRDGTE